MLTTTQLVLIAMGGAGLITIGVITIIVFGMLMISNIIGNIDIPGSISYNGLYGEH